MIRRLLAALIGVAAVVALASCDDGESSAGQSPSALSAPQSGGKYSGLGLNPARPRPSFTLTDTDGEAFSFQKQTAGRPTLLFFGYTTCPDICPATLADIMLALPRVPADVQKKTDVVFVTTDVKTDTASRIKQWLANFSGSSSARFIGLRGTQAEIDAAQAAAHVALAEDNGKTHSAQVLLYGADDYAHVSFLYNGTETLEQDAIAHDLPLVANGG